MLAKHALVYSMGRLKTQDRKMKDMIARTVENEEPRRNDIYVA